MGWVGLGLNFGFGLGSYKVSVVRGLVGARDEIKKKILGGRN